MHRTDPSCKHVSVHFLAHFLLAVAVNEETGFAYIVGTAKSGARICGGGLHMVNIQNPKTPIYAGCFSADGYTHDTQCVTYRGPDSRYTGRELCFSSNEDTLTVVSHPEPRHSALCSPCPWLLWL